LAIPSSQAYPQHYVPRGWKQFAKQGSPFTRGEPHVGTITVGHRGGMGGFSHKGGLGFNSLASGADQAMG